MLTLKKTEKNSTKLTHAKLEPVLLMQKDMELLWRHQKLSSRPNYVKSFRWRDEWKPPEYIMRSIDCTFCTLSKILVCHISFGEAITSDL